MASTRNRNTESDYKLEQLQNTNHLENNLYLHSASGRPNNECFPELYNPSKLSRDALSPQINEASHSALAAPQRVRTRAEAQGRTNRRIANKR